MYDKIVNILIRISKWVRAKRKAQSKEKEKDEEVSCYDLKYNKYMTMAEYAARRKEQDIIKHNERIEYLKKKYPIMASVGRVHAFPDKMVETPNLIPKEEFDPSKPFDYDKYFKDLKK